MIMKFITLNLYEGGLLFDAVLKFLEEENPDIFVLQEVNNGKGADLPQRLRSIEVITQSFQNIQSRIDEQYFLTSLMENMIRFLLGKISLNTLKICSVVRFMSEERS